MVNTQVRQTKCLFTNKWRLFLTIIEVTLCAQTPGDSSFGTLKKTNWRYCIAELTFIFGVLIKPAIISEHFREYRSPIRTFGKKKNKRHGLPVHRFYHAAFAPKRWNGTETALILRYGDCRFLPNANCGEKNFESGAKREGRSGFRKQYIFFFFFFFLPYNHIEALHKCLSQCAQKVCSRRLKI